MTFRANYPDLQPSLQLNFSRGRMDPRVTFTRASTATRTNAAGLIETVASGAPRFDYDPVTLACKGLLIEEARTNLLIQSNDISNAAFSKTNVVATANTTASPSGAMDAALVVDNATSAEHYFQQNCTTATNQTYTQSIFVKAGTSAGFSFMVVSIGASVTTSVITFGQSGGVFTQTSGLVGLITAASVVAVAGGWYRCSVTYTLDGTVTAHLMRIYPKVAGIYVGTGVGAYFWGAQLEAGSTATRYQSITTATDYDTVGFPHYLKFDGVDDSMATASTVDFTATDKMTLFAGARKLSDATKFAMVCESSNSVNVNSGTFALTLPQDAATVAGVYSRGSQESMRKAETAIAPSTVVVSARLRIATDTNEVKVNGGTAVTGAADQGTGNYGNYPLFIGARNSSSLFFSGNIYSLIIRGELSSDAQIINAETYVNSKTGAY